MSWLTVDAESIAAGDTTLNLAANASRALPEGAYDATLYFLGDVNGAETTAVDVSLTVEPPVFRAFTTGQVVDWGGRPLAGDGSSTSCVFQVIYAGDNGVADPPAADGAPDGDDVLLTALTGLSFGVFGEGEDVGAGQFDALFSIPRSIVPEGGLIYVRAWDAPSPSAAMAYGDSEVRHAADFSAGEEQDFGSWTVGTAVSDLSDANGDTIPDAWAMQYRPDLDPRAEIVALETDLLSAPTNQIRMAGADPIRVVASDKFLFVLDFTDNLLRVYDRAYTNALVLTYGATGSGEGQFRSPKGLAIDLANNRLAVADTLNHRVQVFTFDPETGDIAFEAAFGSQSAEPSIDAADGTFSAPRAVAFCDDGSLLVADTGNYRVQLFDYNRKSSAWVHSDTFLTAINGDIGATVNAVCHDTVDSAEGSWIVDEAKGRRSVSFYEFGNPTPVRTIGDGTFDDPTDVQVWTVGSRSRLVVTDQSGARVRILGYDGNVLADLGTAYDIPLETYEKLALPYAAFPVSGTNLVYVADRGNDRVVWFGVLLDGDGDGMDDLWEDVNGLDSSVDDAQEDADGDGLANIGEYRAGTDPQNEDTDGDGVGDQAEMINLTDPLEPSDAAEGEAALEVVSITASPTVIGVGQKTTITITLSGEATGDSSVTLYAKDGSALAVGKPSAGADKTKLVFRFTGTEPSIGLVTVAFTTQDTDPPTTTAADLFEVTQEPVEEEETEEVRWRITSVEYKATATPPVFVIRWDFDLAEAAAATFRIDHSADLDTWTEKVLEVTIDGAAGANEGVAEIDLSSDYIRETANFFRLWWTNHPVE